MSMCDAIRINEGFLPAIETNVHKYFAFIASNTGYSHVLDVSRGLTSPPESASGAQIRKKPAVQAR